MKLIRIAASLFRKVPEKNVQYYDNYAMLGSILGSYCSMTAFGGGKKKR